jgi:hypothetical protein
MAKPIKETPVLTGKDAINFMENIKIAESSKVDKDVKERIKSNFDKLNSIAKF